MNTTNQFKFRFENFILHFVSCEMNECLSTLAFNKGQRNTEYNKFTIES